MAGKVIIAVHDVCQQYLSQLKEMLGELSLRGYHKRSLLVIGKDASQSEGLAELLHRESGNEVALHGWDHSAHGTYREFKEISREEAAERISRGLQELSKLGINPDVFVPPYWKVSAQGRMAVQDTGLGLIIQNPDMERLSDGRTYSCRPVWFWPYNSALDHIFRAFDHFLVRFHQRGAPLVRMELHPQDMDRKKPFDVALKLIRYLKNMGREMTTYKEFMESI